MRNRKRLLVLAGLFVLLLLTPLVMRWRAQARLASYKRELVAAGEKIKIEELAPVFTAQDERNAAKLAVAEQSLVNTIDFLPYSMKAIKPGVARVAWREDELIQEDYPLKIYTNVWPLLRQAQATNSQRLAEIGELLSAGVSIPTDYQTLELFSNGPVYLMEGRTVSYTAIGEATLDLRDHRPDEAMQRLLLGLDVVLFQSSERLMISQFLSYAEARITLEACWEAIQYKGWSDEQLTRLQEKWEEIDFLSAGIMSLAMERAREPLSFAVMRTRMSKTEFESAISSIGGVPSGAQIWQDTLEHPLAGGREALDRALAVPRYFVWKTISSYDDERLLMKLYQDMMDELRAVQRGQRGPREADSRLEGLFQTLLAGADPSAQYPMTAMEQPILRKFIGQTLQAQTEVSLVTAAIALERYQMRHHQYPATLQELAPVFLKRVPIDYLDGKILCYRLRPNGSYLLYSVGVNGMDDGGDPSPASDENLGISMQRGRDWVWPRAATVKEVEEFEMAEMKKRPATTTTHSSSKR